MRNSHNQFLSLRITMTLVLVLVALTTGCASTSTGGSSSGPTQAQLTQAGIKTATGDACLRVAEKHPDRLDAYSADLAVATAALIDGKTYDIIRALVLKNANLSPQEVVIVSPALDLLDTYFKGQTTGGIGGSVGGGLNVAPKPGSDAYLAVQAALDGCRNGLGAAHP